MSTKSKGTSIEKIIKEFQKSDVDEQVKVYFQLKEYLNKKLDERQSELEAKTNEIQSTKERL